MLDTDSSELNNLLHEEAPLMDSRKLSVLCLSPDDDISDAVSSVKEPFEGRYWRQHCRSLSFSSCPQTRKTVTNRLEYYRVSNSPTQTEDSPRGWQVGVFALGIFLVFCSALPEDVHLGPGG